MNKIVKIGNITLNVEKIIYFKKRKYIDRKLSAYHGAFETERFKIIIGFDCGKELEIFLWDNDSLNQGCLLLNKYMSDEKAKVKKKK